MIVKVPKEFKFLTHKLKIRYDDKELASSGTIGLSRFYHEEILIKSVVPLDERNQILFHELLHVIERYFGLKFEDMEIDTLAEGLVYLLKEILGIEFDWKDIDGIKEKCYETNSTVTR